MTKLIISMLLLNTSIFAAEIEHVIPHSSKPLLEKRYLPLQLGNKIFTHNELKTLSSENRNKLIKISHPSCISRCYGLHDNLVQPQDIQTLQEVFKNNPSLIKKSFEITSKTKDTGQCSCNEDESLSCCYLVSYARLASMLSFVGYAAATTIPAIKSVMTYAIGGCLLSIPVGCVAVELDNCLCYRCCSGHIKYRFKQPAEMKSLPQ